jgi:O-antigen/teichoic acid export membrane protein
MSVLGGARRAGWAILDQALSSGTNFVLAVAVARTSGAADFGAFTLALGAYLVALAVSRALASEPFAIRYSAVEVEAWRTGTARATGSAFVVGSASGLLCVALGITIGGEVGPALAVLGVGLPGLLVQDAWRFAFFAARRGRDAFANDLAWTVALAVALGCVIALGADDADVLIFAWAVGGAVGAIVGVIQSGVRPCPLQARTWWREHRDIAPRLVVEGLVLSGTQQAAFVGIAGVAGLAVLGALRAGQVLMNAMHVITYAIPLFAVPEAVHLRMRSTPALLRFCILIGGTLAALAILWGTALLLTPEQLGRALLRDNWTAARPVLLGVTVATAAAGTQMGALVGLRSLASTRRSLAARVASSMLIFVGGVAGAAMAGAAGAAWGMAAGVCIGTVLWWAQFVRATRGVATASSYPAPAGSTALSGSAE